MRPQIAAEPPPPAEPADPTVVSAQGYKGGFSLDIPEGFAILTVFFDWGSRSAMTTPTGGSWTLLAENAIASDGPMIQTYVGEGGVTAGIPSTTADAWVHAHAYVFPEGSSIVDADAIDGTGGFTISTTPLAGGDTLVCFAGKSYEGGAFDYTVDDLTTTRTDPTGEYANLWSGWSHDNLDEARAFTSVPGIARWTSVSATVRTLPAEGFNDQPSQPAAIVYGSMNTALNSYDEPGALVIAGRDNFDDPVFETLATGGATVLLYTDAVILNNFGTYHEIIHQDSVAWPGVAQANSTGFLADFREGQPVHAALEAALEQAVTDLPFLGGFFADDLGSRAWFPGFDWELWTDADKLAYRRGALALARTYHRVAQRHGLIVVLNGTWHGGDVATQGGGHPFTDAIGCSLVEGGTMENWDGFDPTFRQNYVEGANWGVGTRGKLMFAITPDADDRDDWASSGEVAWVSYQSDYGIPTTPWTTFHPYA